MSRKKPNISLAGWLFADLALVLFVIFLPSRVSGDDIVREESDPAIPTTTTTPVEMQEPEGRGVVPDPIEIFVKITGNSISEDEVLAALEDGLISANVSGNLKFGVVQVLAGIRGEDSVESRDDASKRASVVEKILVEIAEFNSSSENRLKPWLYTLSGSDKSIKYPTMKLRLFPDNE